MNEVAQMAADPQRGSPDGSGVFAGLHSELFVINLCTSMTPMPALPKQLKGFEKYRLYQVSRQEDGRRRYRLRLGFFTTEADAEIAVSAIRSHYPAAFTGGASSEDQRFLSESFVPAVTPPPTTSPQVPAPASAPPTTPVVKATPLRTAAAAPVNPVNTARPAQVDLDMTARHQTLGSVASTQAAQPAPTRRLVAAPTAKPMTASATKAATGPATPKPIVATSIVSPPMPRTPGLPLGIRPPQIVDDFVPVLDSTLTIRTLTSSEAEDPNKPKWFVVQLALSEQPVNLDAMPKLDIFAAYSLYSVALMEGGTIRHALRLGFFKEKVSAEAVMGYLKTFFGAPTVNQVSTSEYDRFAESKPSRTTPSQDKVVNLDNKRETSPSPAATRARTATPTVATPARMPAAGRTVTDKRSGANNAANARQQSFLSRLIGRQLD